MVRRHTVHTRHPRYVVEQYDRGIGAPVSQPSWTLYRQYPDLPADIFGYTNDPNQALWIMPDGGMLSGAKDPSHIWTDYAHKDVVRAYGLSPSENETIKWMQIAKAIRMRRTSMAPDATLNLEMYQVPNESQMRAIVRAVDREGTIYAEFFTGDGKTVFSQRFRNPAELRRMLDTV